jgi:hypothetical protein
MSQSRLTTTSSSHYQAIFDDALEIYRKKTGEDPLSHPLRAELESCNCPIDVLTVLRQQFLVLDQRGNGTGGLMTLLNSTVKVLSAFSATLGQNIGLVSLRSLS